MVSRLVGKEEAGESEAETRRRAMSLLFAPVSSMQHIQRMFKAAIQDPSSMVNFSYIQVLNKAWITGA